MTLETAARWHLNWIFWLAALSMLMICLPNAALAEPPDLNGPCPNDANWTIRIFDDSTKSNPHYICIPPCGINERTIIFKDGMEHRGNLVTCDNTAEPSRERVVDSQQTTTAIRREPTSQPSSPRVSRSQCSDYEIELIQAGNDTQYTNGNIVFRMSPEWSEENIRRNKSYLCTGP